MAELSPLRRRMIEDMTIRNMSPATQRSYISAVSKFSRYFGRSPDKLTLDDVHAFQVHLVSTGISWPGLNQIVCALRFFYGVTLGEAASPGDGFVFGERSQERWRRCRRPVVVGPLGARRAPASAGDSLKMRRVNGAPASTLQFAVNRHFATGVEYAHGARAHRHPHPFANQPPRHGIGVAVHLDRAVGADPARQFAPPAGARKSCVRVLTPGLDMSSVPITELEFQVMNKVGGSPV